MSDKPFRVILRVTDRYKGTRHVRYNHQNGSNYYGLSYWHSWENGSYTLRRINRLPLARSSAA